MKYAEDSVNVQDVSVTLYFSTVASCLIVKSDIYPGELVLNRENVSGKKTPFLDIQIEIVDSR